MNFEIETRVDRQRAAALPLSAGETFSEHVICVVSKHHIEIGFIYNLLVNILDRVKHFLQATDKLPSSALPPPSKK